MAKTTWTLIQSVLKIKLTLKPGDLFMREVPNETYIPSDDLAKIRARLVNQINSMSDADFPG